MRNRRKYRVLTCFLAVSALTISACTPNYRANQLRKTNHFGPKSHPGIMSVTHRHPHNGHHMRAPMPQFQQWVEHEPEYTLYPGDQVDIVVSSAPELSRTLTIGPDGRIVMPMSAPVMAAGRTFSQVERDLSAQLSKQLRDPQIALTPRAYGPQQIFVGGEVAQQGTYTLPGPVGAIEAVMMAGGLRDSARTSRVAVLRRAPNGGMMMRTVNLSDGMRHLAHYNDVIQLRRGDIVFVPRTTLAEVGVWMQQFRAALPVDFNVSYQFGNNDGVNTFISP